MSSFAFLDQLPRHELIERARAAGVQRPELMTRVELKDEIVRLTETDEQQRQRSRGWLGVARDLVASVVEQGLHMPDAAAVIRGDVRIDAQVGAPPPVATVTLAEIYAAQGHVARSLALLDEVLRAEPDHEAARRLRARLAEQPPATRKRAVPAVSAREATALDATQPDDAEPPSAAAPRPWSSFGAQAHGSAVEAIAAVQSGEPAPSSVPRSEAAPATPSPPSGHEPDGEGAVALRAGGDTVHFHWELKPGRLERARANAPDGSLTLRVLRSVASWQGAELSERDLAIDASRGSTRLDGVTPGTVIRAAVGWRDGARFEPLVVASELTRDDTDWRVSFAPAARETPELRPLERRALHDLEGARS